MKNFTQNIFIGFIFILFSLGAFFAIYSNLQLIFLHEKVKNFNVVNATVIDYDLKISKGSKSSTSKVVGNYEYFINNKKYTSSNIGLSNMSNNFDKKTKNKQLDYLSKKNIKIYVNPKNYNESYVFKELPTAEITFINFFIIFPLFIGVLFLTSIPIFIKNFILRKDSKSPNYKKDIVDKICGNISYIIFIFFPTILLLKYSNQLTGFQGFINFSIIFVCSIAKFAKFDEKKLNFKT